jgi:hypothetical protein
MPWATGEEGCSGRARAARAEKGVETIDARMRSYVPRLVEKIIADMK